MANAPDLDVKKAWKAKWDTHSELVDAFTGKLHSGRIPKDTPFPRAQLSTKEDRPAQFSTGGVFVDYRRVCVVIQALTEEKVGELVGLVKGKFDEQALTIDNAAWIRTEPKTVETAQEDQTKGGESYWRAKVEWCVWNQRSV